MKLTESIELEYQYIEALELMIKLRKVRLKRLNKLARESLKLAQRYYTKGKL